MLMNEQALIAQLLGAGKFITTSIFVSFSRESHHRGQIMLALKQNGMRLPGKISVQGIWGE